MSLGGGGGGRHNWFYSLNSKQDDTRDWPGEISAHPSQQQPINLFLSKATNQETPVLAKPISAPRLDRRISNSVSLPVRGKSGLPSCAREATKPDFVYRKLIRQFHTTASDILLQLLPFTTVSRNRLVILLPIPLLHAPSARGKPDLRPSCAGPARGHLGHAPTSGQGCQPTACQRLSAGFPLEGGKHGMHAVCSREGRHSEAGPPAVSPAPRTTNTCTQNGVRTQAPAYGCRES